MSVDQFRREKMYQATMLMAKKLHEQAIISTDEYLEIDTIFRKKYAPSLGTLFTEINLI